MAKIKYTTEQKIVIKAMRDSSENIRVAALAGTGKTFTILQGIKHSPKKRFLLLSFNRHLQAEYESKKKSMKLRNLDISTFHSMATKYTVNNRESLDVLGTTFPPKKYRYIGYIHGRVLKSYGYAGSAWDASQEMKEFNNSNKVLDEASPFIKKAYLEAFKKGEITHDMYVKVFLTNLTNGTISLADKYDTVIIDEAQDLAEGMYNCFKSLGINQLVEIGDKDQALYAFMLKDFNVFNTPANKILTLNQSFRTSNKITRAVQNAVLSPWLDFEGQYKGVAETSYEDKSVWYVCRTNANVLQIALKEVYKGNSIVMTKGYLNELLAPVYAVRDLSFALKDGIHSSKYAKCKTVTDVTKVNDKIPKDLAYDLLEYMHEGFWQTLDVTSYLQKFSSLEYKRAIGISGFIQKKNLTIAQIKETILGNASRKADIKITTVHKAKGEEAGTAILVGFKSFSELLIEVRGKVFTLVNGRHLERRELQFPQVDIGPQHGLAPYLEIIDVYPDALPVIEFKSEIMMVYVAITRAKHSVEIFGNNMPDWWTKELQALGRPVNMLLEKE